MADDDQVHSSLEGQSNWDEELWEALSHVIALIEDLVAAPLAEDHSLSIGQFELLRRMGAHPEGLTEPALELGLRWHQMRVIYELRRLQRRGLLVRPKRTGRLHLTMEGEELVKASGQDHQRLMHDLVRHHVSEETRAALMHLAAAARAEAAIETLQRDQRRPAERPAAPRAARAFPNSPTPRT